MSQPSDSQMSDWVASVHGIRLSPERAKTLAEDFGKANSVALQNVGLVEFEHEPSHYLMILTKNAELGA